MKHRHTSLILAASLIGLAQAQSNVTVAHVDHGLPTLQAAFTGAQEAEQDRDRPPVPARAPEQPESRQVRRARARKLAKKRRKA